MNFSYTSALDFLASTPTAKKDMFRAGDGFERARHFFALLKNPQDDFRSVHIAGTSGKGTVAYMIEALLRECGQTTGLTISPHVYDIRERCIINGALIPEDEFAEVIKNLMAPSLEMEKSAVGRPTYFEMTNAIAFKTFADKQVDYGVIETGLGGLYDSTNTISRTDKLAVITKLGLDHTEILGDTIDKIAAQKAGILPINGEAVVWKSAPEALAAVEATAAARGTKLDIVDEAFFTVIEQNPNGIVMDYHDSTRHIKDIQLPAGGMYQAENAVMAIRSTLRLAKRDGFIATDQAVRDAMSRIAIPGRVEQVRLFDHDVILDGAHNPQKMEAFLEVVDALPEKPIFVIGLKKTKEAETILRLILPYADQLIVTQFFTNQENGLMASYSAAELAEIVEQLGGSPVIYEDNHEAIRYACERTRLNQQVVVTGSFYLLGEIHDKLNFKTA